MTKIFAMSCNMEPGHTKKQSNIRIRRTKEMILLFHLTRVVMSCVKNIHQFFSGSKQKAGSKIMWVKSEILCLAL